MRLSGGMHGGGGVGVIRSQSVKRYQLARASEFIPNAACAGHLAVGNSVPHDFVFCDSGPL